MGYNYLYTGKEETVPIKVEDKLMSTQSDKDKNSEITTVTRINSEEKMLLKKIGVKISNLDIYNYANDVAEKNGYAKISYQGFKNKNLKELNLQLVLKYLICWIFQMNLNFVFLVLLFCLS